MCWKSPWAPILPSWSPVESCSFLGLRCAFPGWAGCSMTFVKPTLMGWSNWLCIKKTIAKSYIEPLILFKLLLITRRASEQAGTCSAEPGLWPLVKEKEKYLCCIGNLWVSSKIKSVYEKPWNNVKCMSWWWCIKIVFKRKSSTGEHNTDDLEKWYLAILLRLVIIFQWLDEGKRSCLP